MTTKRKTTRTDWKKLAEAYKKEYSEGLVEIRLRAEQIGKLLTERRDLLARTDKQQQQLNVVGQLLHVSRQAQAVAGSVCGRISLDVEAAALRDTARRLGEVLEVCGKVGLA